MGKILQGKASAKRATRRNVTQVRLLEHHADLNRDAERVEADKASLQSRSYSDAARDLGRADGGRSGAKRQAEGAERLRIERQTSDQAIKGERLRTDAATAWRGGFTETKGNAIATFYLVPQLLNPGGFNF